MSESDVWTNEDTRKMHADFALYHSPLGALLRFINDPQCPAGMRDQVWAALERLGYVREDDAK